MKRILTVTLALALATFIFSSCSKDKKDKELKTLEGTSWTSNSVGGGPAEATLDFAPSTDEFELRVTSSDGSGWVSGTYTFNYPNITFTAYDGDGFAPSLTPAPAPETYVFQGVINGKTLTVYNFFKIDIVFNMK